MSEKSVQTIEPKTHVLVTGAVSVQWGVLLPTVWGICTLVLIDLTKNITEMSNR